MAFTEHLADLSGVDAVTASLIELDQEVQNIKITAEGESLDYDAIEDAVDGLGGTVHSVDEVGYGAYIVDAKDTLQDA